MFGKANRKQEGENHATWRTEILYYWRTSGDRCLADIMARIPDQQNPAARRGRQIANERGHENEGLDQINDQCTTAVTKVTALFYLNLNKILNI